MTNRGSDRPFGPMSPIGLKYPPANLSYEKPDPTPGWDESLWPKTFLHRLFLSARLSSWRQLVGYLVLSIILMIPGLFLTTQALHELHLVVLPPKWVWAPPSPWFTEPIRVLLAGCFFAALSGWGMLYLPATMIAKWAISRPTPNPDYRRLRLFSPRRKRKNDRPN